MAAPPFDAVVLAGGKAARLGGADKPGLLIAGRTLLDRVLAAVRQAQRRVVVGPPRPLPPDVIVCREQPPGGGPVAALAAGLPQTRSEVVVVLGADLPWIGPAVPVLVAALAPPDGDAAALVDGCERPNLLASAWRRAALVGALTRVGDPTGRSMRLLASHADVRPVADPEGWGEDCDTWQDFEQARRRAHEPIG